MSDTTQSSTSDKSSKSRTIGADAFIQAIRKSNLVDEADLKVTLGRVKKAAGGKIPNDSIVIAEAMIVDERLTTWQVEKLLTGKYKGFFLGKFKLLGHIGSGGMSSVYLAQHTKMKDLRAIKVLPKKRINDATYLARFQLEAKAIASLNHDSIVRAYDIDNDGDLHYIVMEYVAGDDLQQIVKRCGPLSYTKTADYIAQAARGLAHAHECRLIHRDVKPANLLVNKHGRVKLLDMGLALLESEEDHSLTVANNENVLGTADYLAPEQALNSHKVDHRVDIYGLGCTMYFLLTGRPPFNDGSLAQRIIKHQTEMPEDIRNFRPDCPGELDGICTKMLQKDPRFRYPDCTAVAEALESWLARAKQETLASASAGNRGGTSHSGIGVSSSSDIDIAGSTIHRGSDIGVGLSSAETLSSRGDDTRGGGASDHSGVLSASDSGRLITSKRIRSPSSSLGGSAIDLQRESGYSKSSNRLRPGAKSDNPMGQNAGKQRKVVPLAGTLAAKSVQGKEPVMQADKLSLAHPALVKHKERKEKLRKIVTALLIIGGILLGFVVAKIF